MSEDDCRCGHILLKKMLCIWARQRGNLHRFEKGVLEPHGYTTWGTSGNSEGTLDGRETPLA